MPGVTQPTLFDLFDASALPQPSSVSNAIEHMASNSSAEARGAIFTRIEVVNFILDLVGYNADKPLYHQRILEPSFGNGDFLLPIVDRLLTSWEMCPEKKHTVIETLGECIRAVELHRDTYSGTRDAVLKRLNDSGIPTSSAIQLADLWLVQGDFLLEQQNFCFDFVVGNPPYVRQELISAPLLAEYRRRFSTMYDRADLYIPFIEKSLALLRDGGTLGFICADRWMKNRYGGPLRGFISQGFYLKVYVDMEKSNAFYGKVSAYPAITIIGRAKQGATRIAHNPKSNTQTLASTAKDILGATVPKDSAVREMVDVVNGTEPWLLESSDQMSLIRRIETRYPTLEEAGCKVGIGVATGLDAAFIGDYESLDVEPDRKLPLVTTRDIQTGEVVWRGQGVINPFADDGRLVELQAYPKLARYLEEHRDMIAKRHCAKKAPANWFRTIDRIWPELTQKPKLLVPDIKGEAHIVFESGTLYPHHNLYYVTSEAWDLRALQAVLLSCLARLFVASYSTKMRGGYLRFQAQYIRRIRIPLWENVSATLRQELIQAAMTRELAACNSAVFKLYELSREEQATLGGNGV
ncbi:MAG: Eco57I restriction-modification methylase domain-containing protein [Mariprofundaceae bacterium]|nr:Eco57I restriction-modification methylase domain-containing protein [Mariprofundaceae bacterium]